MARLAETKPRIPFYDREFGLSDQRLRDLYLSIEAPFRPNLVFVMMSFEGAEMNDSHTAIKDACARLGLVAWRVDENLGSGLIIREIATMINEAEFIVCDLTHERPNVYYELGYAHGTGNSAANILLVAKQGTKPHFDIAPLRIQFYRSTEHLRSIVDENLQHMMKNRGADGSGEVEEVERVPGGPESSGFGASARIEPELRTLREAIRALDKKLAGLGTTTPLSDDDRRELAEAVHALSQHHDASARRYRADVYPYASGLAKPPGDER